VEVLGYGNWFDAPLPLVQGGHATYFGAEVPFDLGTLAAIEFVLIGGAEALRAGGEGDKSAYPGFDPAGLSKSDLDEKKTKEIKNGRLAMLAFVGFVAQHAATGATPLQALGAHLADPFGERAACLQRSAWPRCRRRALWRQHASAPTSRPHPLAHRRQLRDQRRFPAVVMSCCARA
jgi:hypothetical protein